MLPARSPATLCCTSLATPVANCVCGTGATMDEDRFDYLAKALNTSASRRLALRSLVAALVANFSHFAPIATLAITRGSGGSGNRAIVGGGGRRRHDSNKHQHHRKRKDRKCRPKSRSKLCLGNCDRVVGDGCGGKV